MGGWVSHKRLPDKRNSSLRARRERLAEEQISSLRSQRTPRRARFGNKKMDGVCSAASSACAATASCAADALRAPRRTTHGQCTDSGRVLDGGFHSPQVRVSEYSQCVECAMLGNVWEVCASARQLADVQISSLRTNARSPTRAREMDGWMVCEDFRSF